MEYDFILKNKIKKRRRKRSNNNKTFKAIAYILLFLFLFVIILIIFFIFNKIKSRKLLMQNLKNLNNDANPLNIAYKDKDKDDKDI